MTGKSYTHNQATDTIPTVVNRITDTSTGDFPIDGGSWDYVTEDTRNLTADTLVEGVDEATASTQNPNTPNTTTTAHTHNMTAKSYTHNQATDTIPTVLNRFADASTGVLPVQDEGWDYLTEDTHSIPACLLYTSPSPRDRQKSRMPSSA